MSYVAYEDITSPNEVVNHIAEYVRNKGYTIVQDYADDNDIYGGSITDGKKLVFKDKTGNYYINLRSCNGYQIFGSGDESYQDTLNANSFKDESLMGVGMTVSEGYSSTTRWYNQYRVPNKFKTNELLGVYMPVPPIGEGDIEKVPMPEKVQKPDDTQEPVIPSYPSKPVAPTGVSQAIGYQDLTESVNDLVNLKLSDGYYKEGSKWTNYGGKNADTLDNMQFKETNDGGKNENTLNNMTVNIPIYTAILDNPEGANPYAGTGEVIGVYFISLLNIATASVYKHMYPRDEPMCQVFPMGRRRGYYGFDGISIEQTWR